MASRGRIRTLSSYCVARSKPRSGLPWRNRPVRVVSTFIPRYRRRPAPPRNGGSLDASSMARGSEVAAGAVIGLIEAMKLFNEIKTDVAGTVTRVMVESGQLVKRQQPLIEIDPS